MTRLTTCPDADTVAARATEEIARQIEQAIRARGVAHVALSGGTTPGHTYSLLAASPLDWSAVEVWFADERCVGPEDEESNYRLAAQTLLEGPAIEPEHVHRMRGELGPHAGAEQYARELREHLPLGDGRLPQLDVVVLGIGPDGHIASLFPGSWTLGAGEGEVCLGVEDSPKPPPERITLSLAVLRAARSCVLLATGSSKADALDAMLGEPSDHVPASLLERGRLTVIADDEASPPRSVNDRSG